VKLFLRLALRNVFRNRVRTAVALLAVAVGCAAVIVNGGVIYNIFGELREDAIFGRHGHLQIYRRGYSEHHLSEPDRYLIPATEVDRILTLLRGQPHVARATRRREFSGLVSRSDRYVAFLGIGVDPEDDTEFSRHTTLRDGAPLSAADPSGVLAGLGLAAKFDGRPGTAIGMITVSEAGSVNAVDAHLRGVFEGGFKEYDDWTLKVPLAAARGLLRDDRIEQIVVLLDRTDAVAATRAAIEAVFARERLDLEIKSWNELALFHNQVVSLFGRELGVIEFVVATIVILGIGSAIGMSVFERHVELATMRALGLTPATVAALLLTEALLTGLIGGALGVALGALIASVATAIGIPYPSPPGSTRPFLGGVDLVPGMVIFAFSLSVGATLAAALVPALRVLRRSIADTLRQV